MSINSSAFNITASGKHSFDNSFDYRLKILLSDVLFNRAKTRRREISEFYVEENMKNQSTIPLVISGTPDNYDVQFDKQRAFNLSSKNQPDAENDIERNPDPSGFIIEWDEEISPVNNGQNSERNYSEDDYIIQWGEDDKDSTN